MQNLKNQLWLPLLVALISGIVLYLFQEYYGTFKEQSKGKISKDILFQELSGGTPVSKIGMIIPAPDKVEELSVMKIYKWRDDEKKVGLNCSISKGEESIDGVYLTVDSNSVFEIELNKEAYALGQIKVADLTDDNNFRVYVESPKTDETYGKIVAVTLHDERVVHLESHPIQYKGRKLADYDLNTIFYSAEVLPLKDGPLGIKQQDYNVWLKARKFKGKYYENPIYGKWVMENEPYQNFKKIASFYTFNPSDETGHFYYQIEHESYSVEFYAPFSFEYAPNTISDTIRFNYGKFYYSLNSKDIDFAQIIHTAAIRVELAYAYKSKLFELEFSEDYQRLDIYTDDDNIVEQHIEDIFNVHDAEYSKVNNE